MSSEIFYKRAALRFAPIQTGLQEDLLVLVALAGSSNCTTTRYGRDNRPREVLSRSWCALGAGSYTQVIRRTIRIGCDTYGGMLKVGSRRGDTQGSTFVAGTRRILNAARESTLTLDGHPLWVSFGLPRPTEKYGTDPSDGTLPEYFKRDDIQMRMADGTLHQVIQVYGPED